MATVQSFVKCPQCGNAEADHLYNSRTGEEDSFCTRCGYHETWRGNTTMEETARVGAMKSAKG